MYSYDCIYKYIFIPCCYVSTKSVGRMTWKVGIVTEN